MLKGGASAEIALPPGSLVQAVRLSISLNEACASFDLLYTLFACDYVGPTILPQYMKKLPEPTVQGASSCTDPSG